MVYADTGFLCSLCAPDAHTDRAIRRMQRHPAPLSFTWIHRLELRNAFRLRVFRRETTAEQRDASLRFVREDLSSGALVACEPAMRDLEIEAEHLSASYSERFGTRSLDVLHVAACLVLGNEVFLTFDKRQARLARAGGLTVPRI